MRRVSMPINRISNDTTIGKAYVATTFVKIDWVWLSLPVLVWVLSFVVWLGTMWQSRRVGAPMWRDNVLPLLWMSPENEGAIRVPLDPSSGGYTRRAENITARLTRSENQLELVTG